MTMRNGIPTLRVPIRGAFAATAVAAFLAALLILVPEPAGAQELTPELLEQAARQSGMSQDELLRRYRAQGGVPVGDALQEPGRTTLPDAYAAPRVVLPFAAEIEAMTQAAVDSAVAEERMPQAFFGADFFSGDPALFAPVGFGPVPRDYMLGPGDQVVVDVWGEVEFRHERLVERDGSIILPKAGRVACAGRTLDQVSGAVREALSRSYSGIKADGSGGDTFVEVNLGRLRAIRVFVVGEAARPGAYDMSSVATVFTALHAAGGPSAAGSLRDVRVMRGDEVVGSLDLYDYLLTGSRLGDVVLREGDTVFVPPRKITVTIDGAVRRPLTYEMLPDEGVRDLVEFAGGFTAEAETRLLHVARILPPLERAADRPDRVQRDLDLRLKMKHLLQDGDRVTVAAVADRLVNWIQVDGNVKRPGRYEFNDGQTVRGVIAQAGGLWDDTMMDRATLDRVAADGTYRSLDVPLRDIMAGKAEDVPLHPRDTLRFYSLWDLKDRYEVHITGAVREPGSFAWREGMTLRDLVLKAGGLQDSADLLHAEVSRLSHDALTKRDLGTPPASTIDVIHVEMGDAWLSNGFHFELKPHDRVAIRKLPWWQLQRTVTLEGEVSYPGVYTLDRPDERLSAVIARAGGLKPTAYAPGARIVRSKDDIGNVALDLTCAVSEPGCDQDAVLESGDVILVPPIPYTVKVSGAVGFPTSVIWQPGRSLGEYVDRAGGFADQSDKWKTHVVYPNGMSKQIRKIWNDPEVMPGSTIVVPRKAPETGEGKLATMKEIASIFASVATVWLVIERTQ